MVTYILNDFLSSEMNCRSNCNWNISISHFLDLSLRMLFVFTKLL